MKRSDQLTMFGELPPPEESLDQYFTDPKVAKAFVEWTRIERWFRARSSHRPVVILEPSCGEGALVSELLRIGCKVIGVEIDAMRADYVRSVFDIEVITGDFMSDEVRATIGDRPEAAVMNSPYSNGRDTDHVIRALELVPRVFALVRLPFLTTLRRYREIWSKNRLETIGMLVRRPEWTCPGEWGARTEYCFTEIVRGLDCDMEVRKTEFGTSIEQSPVLEWIEID